MESSLFALLVLLTGCVNVVNSVKCLDCVGLDCFGEFCEGDYCMIGHYAPRWGTAEWGDPKTIKGCISGSMVRDGVAEHCETDGNDDGVFTCFCDRDYCNGGNAAASLPRQRVPLISCICSGDHCTGRSCIGELCSFVVNHHTHATEQGCVNASVPVIERRTAGSCMMPPITGAMHHSVAKDADDLLVTESCVCATPYCNRHKPVVTVDERQTCATFVQATVMGVKMQSKNVTCSGEFCFKASITSKLGHMSAYRTIGCVSFFDGAELAEELNPTGCAKFVSEQVSVDACFQTSDKEAIARASAHVERGEPKQPSAGRKGKAATGGGKMKQPPPPSSTAPPDDDEEEEEETKEKEEEEEEEEEQEEEVENKSTTEPPPMIFQRPTEAPIPDDSNTTLVACFIVLMLTIVVVGVVWKFELHKKLFRARYDTVTGG